MVTEPPGGEVELGAGTDGAGVVAGTVPVGLLDGIRGVDLVVGATDEGTEGGIVEDWVMTGTDDEGVMVELPPVADGMTGVVVVFGYSAGPQSNSML